MLFLPPLHLKKVRACQDAVTFLNQIITYNISPFRVTISFYCDPIESLVFISVSAVSFSECNEDHQGLSGDNANNGEIVRKWKTVTKPKSQ